MTYRSKIYKIAAVWLYSRLPATFYLWFTHRYKTTPINYWLIVIQNWQWQFVRATSRKQRYKDMDKKFEIGDRVKIVADELPGHKLTLEKGDTGVIVGVAYNGYVRVQFDGHVRGDAFVDGKDLELAEPYDPKTAFLSELKGLLEKYDAKIEYHIGSDDKSDYSEYYAITIGRERLTYDNCDGVSLTADNIMDYDKE